MSHCEFLRGRYRGARAGATLASLDLPSYRIGTGSITSDRGDIRCELEVQEASRSIERVVSCDRVVS